MVLEFGLGTSQLASADAATPAQGRAATSAEGEAKEKDASEAGEGKAEAAGEAKQEAPAITAAGFRRPTVADYAAAYRSGGAPAAAALVLDVGVVMLLRMGRAASTAAPHQQPCSMAPC